MNISAFATIAQHLVERGYSCVPIMPGGKAPGEMRRGEWTLMCDWPRFANRRPSKYEIEIWSTWPRAGVGLIAGPASRHLIGIDIDTDDERVHAAIINALPPSNFVKRGQKGDTRFYRAPSIDKSKSWNVISGEGKKYRACDLIGPGRQTLLPPTIHPDTQQPYVWTGAEKLEDVAPESLPELMPYHLEAIDAALKPFGYEQEPEPLAERRATYEAGGGLDVPIHRRLNDAAIENLSAWVPSLGLYRARRTPQGFEAVATWRASNTGKPIERRKLNLKIARNGIVDFGDGPRNYTPLNLCMAAWDCDLDTAFRGLSNALGWNDHQQFVGLKPRGA